MPSVVLAVVLATIASSPRGAVATAHPLASEVAVEVLRQGGNAVDAAVAAALVLGVVEPQSSGLGGGGFALVYLARERRSFLLDFREVAPEAATSDMYTRPGAPARGSLDGGLAVAVPGAVKGYAELARRFGTMPFARLAEPAAKLAEHGFRVGEVYASHARGRKACLLEDDAAARAFLVPGKDGPVPPPVGTHLVRKDLARTLRLLGRDPQAFYRGPIAERIVAAVRARGGILTLEDLARYHLRERRPLEGHYRGYRILTMPPPSFGGTLLLGLLGALEPEDPRAGGYRPDRYLHVMIEAEKRLFALRSAEFGDPDQVEGVRRIAEEVATPEFAARLRAQITERATPAAEVRGDTEAGETSHLSVVDGEGNAIALTTTVNYAFGSCVVVPGTGLLMNDEMDDFDRAEGTKNAYGLEGEGKNAVAPGKIPLSSMTPTLVFDPAGRLVMAVGAAGGARIPTAVALAVLHVIDDGMDLDAALAAPRLHHQDTPDVVQVEQNGLEADTARALVERGHTLSFTSGRWPNAQAVGVGKDGLFEAACDPRYEGVPLAP
jgi:gamma-glutamyltranspeptidase / glutathione hydrolase